MCLLILMRWSIVTIYESSVIDLVQMMPENMRVVHGNCGVLQYSPARNVAVHHRRLECMNLFFININANRL